MQQSTDVSAAASALLVMSRGPVTLAPIIYQPVPYDRVLLPEMRLAIRKEVEAQAGPSFKDRKDACTQTTVMARFDPPAALARAGPHVAPAILPAVPVAGDPQPSKVDGRGQHWKAKVAQGLFPDVQSSVVEWAQVRAKKQEEFKNFCAKENYTFPLPWDSVKQCPMKGNLLKVLFMDLVMFEFKKVITLKWDKVEEGLYGIMEIHVPPAGVAEFNTGHIPSWTSIPKDAKNRLKTVRKSWSIAGFVESFDPVTGALDFKFSVEVMGKIRSQFSRMRENKKRKADQDQ